MIVNHNIAPVFDARSKVLILGTMPSPKSRETGFYYGHPQNRFWKILSSLFECPLPTSIEEKVSLLINYRIALWDVLKSCEINGASDSSIKNPVPNDFDLIFRYAQIKQVFTTGQVASRLFTRFTGKKSIRLLSPSSANCRTSLEDITDAYQIIIKYLTEL